MEAWGSGAPCQASQSSCLLLGAGQAATRSLRCGHHNSAQKQGWKVWLLQLSGITLLSISGKVLAKVLLHRLIPTIAEEILRESQCGFRANRGTMNMVFVLRQLQEKCWEQNMGLCYFYWFYQSIWHGEQVRTMAHSGMTSLSPQVPTDGDPAAWEPTRPGQAQRWPVRTLPHLQWCKAGSCPSTDSLEHLLHCDAQTSNWGLGWWRGGVRWILSGWQSLQSTTPPSPHQERKNADDAAHVAQTERALQHITSCFADALWLFGLSASRTRRLFTSQLLMKNIDHPTSALVTLNWNPLRVYHSWVHYLI